MEKSDSSQEYLFKNIRYYVVGELPVKTKDILAKAKSESYLSALATHVIVTDPDHYEVESARDIWLIPIVTPLWVELSFKCNTLLPTNAFSPTKKQLFSGLVFTFSNIGKLDKSVLWSLITYNGGKCQAVLNKHCTHLVSPTPSGAKYEESLKHNGITIVAPDWITDSVTSKSLMHHESYHPKLNIVPSVTKKEILQVTEKTNKMKVSTSIDKHSVVTSSSEVAPPVSKSMSIPLQKHVLDQKEINNTMQTSVGGQVSAMQTNPPGMLQQVKTEHHANQPMQTGPNPSRFPVPSPQMQSPHNMMAAQNFAMISGTPNFPMSNQQMMFVPGDQQSMMSLNQQQFLMMSSHVRPTTSSPRRSSSSGKKKKSASQSPRASNQQSIRQPTPNNPQFSAQNQLMFSPQQQMILHARMPGNVDHPNMMQTNNDVKPNLPRPGTTFQGRPVNPNTLQQGDNFQLLQMQQQQMQRMNLMHQTSPRPHMNPMDPKWPRTNMEQGFVTGHHQPMFPNQQQQNMVYSQNQMIRTPNPGTITMKAQQNTMPHQQQYNPMMMNRQVSPQMIYQQRSPNPMNANRFPTSTSLEAAGMSGISPIALQEGLMKAAQMQPDQPALIHPSLQGTLFPKDATAGQSTAGTTTKKRSKSRKKGGEEEVKPRARPKTSKAKKSQVAPVTMTPTNMMATNPGAQYSTMPQFPYSMPGQVPSPSPGRSAPHTPMVSQLPVHAGFGNPPTPVHHQQLQSPTTQQFPGKRLTSSISAPSNNHSWSNQQITNTIPASPKSSFFPQTTMTPTNQKPSPMEVDLKQPQEATVPSRGYCIDPLKCKIKDFDSQYICRDPSVKVTPDLFLLGCVFYIFEYEEVLTDLTVIDLWKKMIGKFGGAVEKIYTSSCTHVICLSCTTPLFRQALMEGKRCVSIYWLNDVLQLRQLIAPWLALHLPTHFSHKLKPATNHTISYTGFHSKERERLKQMAYVCGAKFTGFLSKNNTVLICKNSNSLKYTKAREWSVACVSLRWLRDLLQNDSGPIDLQQPIYQKFNDDFESGFLLDLNKSRGLLEPWRIPVKVTMECLNKSQVKRKLIPLLPSPAVAKRPKQDETFEALPRVCFTGFTSMVTQDLTKKLESLNVKVVSTLSLCTHLVAWNISRTVKFLCCISSCSYVVTPQWVEDSFRKGCLLDEEGYWLSDTQAEEKLKFTLKESVSKAKISALFKDCLFCITEKVAPEKKILKQIVECAGGRVLSKMPSLAVLKHMNSRMSPNNRVFVVSCKEDEAVYLPIRKEGIPVFNAEIILTGVLKQCIEPEHYRI